jgi:pimeloyl-ACP methyl ester carboxylesterase
VAPLRSVHSGGEQFRAEWLIDVPSVAVSDVGSWSPANLRPRRGAFANGMTYARFGDGPKTLLWLSAATRGPMLAMMARAVRPFVADSYSVWLVSGRPNMPTGHTLLDMADDYAALVDEEFGGRVDLVIGHSTGGFIGFCLAGGHPDRFGHVVIAGAALWSQRSDQANLEFSRLLVAGRTREAGQHAVRMLAPVIRVPGLATVLGLVIARASLSAASAQDLLVTAEALHAFDPQEILPRIGVPVLLVAGDKDVYATPEEVGRAAELIPNCTLRLYPDTNHFGAITSPRFAADSLEFIRHEQQAPA